MQRTPLPQSHLFLQIDFLSNTYNLVNWQIGDEFNSPINIILWLITRFTVRISIWVKGHLGRTSITDTSALQYSNSVLLCESLDGLHLVRQVFRQPQQVGLEMFEHLTEQVGLAHTLTCPILYCTVLRQKYPTRSSSEYYTVRARSTTTY
jgi:hypothetical protein